MCGMGNLQFKKVNVTFERNDQFVIFKHVTAEECDVCGNQFFDEKTTDQLQSDVKIAWKQSAEVQIFELQTA